MNWPIRNPSGVWNQWLPDGETQINGQARHDFDESDCLSFKRIHALETIIYHMTGLKIKDSVRYTQYFAKTIENVGAYEATLDSSIPSYGISLELDWPLTDTGNWSDWDEVPPLDVIKKAQSWNRFWKLEMIPITAEQVPLALKTAPVEVIVTISGSENHGVLIPQVGWYFDSYSPFLKQFTSNEVIIYYYLPLLTPMPNSYVKIMNYNGTVGLFMPLDSENPTEINLLNNLYDVQIAPNPDGTIPVQVTTIDKNG